MVQDRIVPSFLITVLGLFIPYVFLGMNIFFRLKYSFQCLCIAGLVDRNCLSVVLSWNVYLFQQIVIDSLFGFVLGYSSMSWHLQSHSVQNIHAITSVFENLHCEVRCYLIMLLDPPPFSFNMLSLFCISSVLIIICLGYFFSSPFYLTFCMFLIPYQVPALDCEWFFYDYIKRIFYLFDLGFLFFLYPYY